MNKLREEGSSVTLSNCRVQENKYEPGTLEILTSRNSTVTPSPKMFKIDDTAKNFNDTVTIDSLDSIATNELINVFGNVASVSPAVELNTKTGKLLKKQDCLLCDTNGTYEIVLWEDDIDKLKKGTSYKLIKARLREYSDMENVVTDDEEDQEIIEETQQLSGEINAVLSTTVAMEH
uniref:Replication protein A OB domain-containing protein n=1 Tax=Amphimedon queenslandica TaxID=400682 RepID=A0A1X7VHE7_AMPQE